MFFTDLTPKSGRKKLVVSLYTASHPVAERLFKTGTNQAQVLAPNQVWAGDIGAVEKVFHMP